MAMISTLILAGGFVMLALAALAALFSRELLKAGINVHDEAYPREVERQERDRALRNKGARFVTYHRSGAISVDLAGFLRSPAGQAQLEQMARLQKALKRT